MKAIEVVFEEPHGRAVRITPLRIKLRSRQLASQEQDLFHRAKLQQIVEEIPGQHLRLDFENRTATIIEPIHKNPKLLKLVERRIGGKLAPDEETQLNQDEAEQLLSWMKRWVDERKARLVSGTLPDELPYPIHENPLAPKPRRGKDRLREIFNRHPETAMQYVGMSDAKKREWESLVGV